MDASQAKSLDLKRQLTTLRKAYSTSIDQYLRDAKQIANSLAAINSPVSNQDFIDHRFKGPDPPSLPQAFAAQNTHSNSSSTAHSYQGGAAGVVPILLEAEVVDHLACFNNIKDLRQATFLAMTLLDKSHQELIVLLMSLTAHSPPIQVLHPPEF
ncbi:hypothetical protein KY289_014680 [Solanum tuberosum]|nr:hypothetical protein KY289_014680 [Solanum tuberosum]